MASVWDDIESLTVEYKAMALGKVIDLKKFNLISLTHHSTRIEGSTLTETETGLLIEEGVSAKGKPMEDHLMVLDHFMALNFTLEQAEKKAQITPSLISQMASAVMKRTGTTVNAAAGSWDETKGEYRKSAARSQQQYYAAYDKIDSMVSELCNKLNGKVRSISTTKDILELAFMAHYDLVQIHPWSDGNGRTARLLMNYVEHYHGQPLTVVKSEDKAAYIDAILATRQNETSEHIIGFLAGQHRDFLKKEIDLYKSQIKSTDVDSSVKNKMNKGYSLIF